MKLLQFIVIASVLALSPALAQEPPRVVTVTGEGRIAAAPDMATVSLGVVAEARGAAEAMDRASRAAADVLARIEQAGIAPRDVQTSDLSLSPRWDHSRSADGGPPRITGYVASNGLTVRVRDLATLGPLLDRLTGDGANSFGGLSFGIADPAPLEDEARRRAVAEARRKAELYAAAAGVTLGPLLSISEAGGMPPPVPLARMEMSLADAVPVAAGELGLTASVTLVYAIAD